MTRSELDQLPKDSPEYLAALALYVFDTRRVNPAEGLELILASEKKARETANPEILSDLLRAKAWCYYYTSDIESSVETALEGAQTGDSAGFHVSSFRNLIVVAYCFIRLGDMKQALDTAHRCAEILEETGTQRTQLEGVMHSVFANIYFELGDMQTSREYNLKAIACFRETGTEDNLIGQISNLGNVERNLGHHEEAMRCYNEARAYYIKNNNLIFWGNLMINVGGVYADEKNMEQQISCYREALELFTKANYQYGIMYAHIMLGKTNVHAGNFPAAETHMNEAEKMATDMRSEKNNAMIIEVLADLEKARGNYQKALEYFTEFHELQRKMLHSQSIIQARNQQIISRLNNAEKERELFRLKNIDLVNLNREVNQKNKDILDSIAYARRIQHAMLPTFESVQALFPSSFLLYLPRDVVSGDFYWAQKTEDSDDIIIAVADCTGHGVPGALLSMLGASLLNEIIVGQHIYSPAAILHALRSKIRSTLAASQSSGKIQDGMDIMCCRIDPAGRKLAYAGANQRLMVCSEGIVTEFRGDKQPIGAGEWDENPFTEKEIDLKIGDTVYLMTDGLADQFGGDQGKKLKYKGIAEFLKTVSVCGMKEQGERVARFISQWQGHHEQTDDICLAGIRL